MKSPIQNFPRGRSIILPASLIAALMAAPMLAFGQTAPAPGGITTQAPSTPGTTTTTTQVPAEQRTTTTTTTTAGAPTNRASRIIGANVLNERNETVGEIEDLIINASGTPPMAVLSVGGFLGIGARLVAVPLSELRFNAERERWVLNGATKESLQARPVYTYQRS